jgi:hypothetical protein
MDKKITIPAGIALMVVLAVAGMLAVFSATASNPVEGSSHSYAQLTFEDVTLLFDTIPDNANGSDDVILKFTTGDKLDSASYITIALHKDYQVPDTIDISHVSISGMSRLNPHPDTPNTPGTATSDVPQPPLAVSVDDEAALLSDDTDDKDHIIQIQIGDMLPGDSESREGSQGITAGADVEVTILKVAGIKAPQEAGTYEVGYALIKEPGTDHTTNTTDLIAVAEVIVPLEVDLSDTDAGRGDEIIATAKGVSDKGTVDFWRDANADGERQQSEVYLCRGVTEEDNVAVCSFTLTSDFEPGHGVGCGGVDEPDDYPTTLPDDCNLVNIRDAEANNADIDWEDDIIELTASVTLNPAEGNPGDSVTVQIRDFDVAGNSVDAVVIRGANYAACGIEADLSALGILRAKPEVGDTEPTVEIQGTEFFATGSGYLPADDDCGENLSNGDADVTIEIPNVTPGERRLDVYVGGANGTDEDASIVIGGSSVLATPTTVLPNQRVTLTGSGFSRNSVINNITLGGDDVNLDELDDDDMEIDSGGSWAFAVNIPVTRGTADGGDLILLVEDEDERTGSTTLTIPEPTVTFTPEEGLVGSTITITGENFPGMNGEDGARDIDVEVEYLVSGTKREDDSVEPDVNGRWQASLEVPNEATIPSTNVVKVTWKVYEDQADDDGTDEIRTFRHRVPPAVISLSPASGPEGSIVTLTGSGFDRFQSMDDNGLEVGSRGVGVSPNPSTDRGGNVSFSFQIPGVDSGIQNVSIAIGGTTASVGFNVTDASGVVGAMTSEVAVALEPLLTAGTLDRVFYFNNATKEWQWHIVDPDFAATNNLDDVVSGAPLWVLVTEDTSAILNTRTVDFTCAGGDCWNLVTFP